MNVATMHGGNSLVALEEQASIQLGSQCVRVRCPIEMKLHGYAAKQADGPGFFAGGPM